MPLIKCPECNAQISDKAYWCPRCGYQDHFEQGCRLWRTFLSAIVARAKHMPVVWIYAGLCLITTVLCMADRGFISVLAISGDDFALTKLSALVTYSLAHANPVHWFFNMIGLGLAGLILEPRLGSLKTILILLAGILATGIGFALFGSTSLIGSSGACYAVIAGLIALWVFQPVSLNLIEKITAVLLAIHVLSPLVFIGPGSAWMPLFGFFAGFLFVFFMNKSDHLTIKKTTAMETC